MWCNCIIVLFYFSSYKAGAMVIFVNVSWRIHVRISLFYIHLGVEFLDHRMAKWSMLQYTHKKNTFQSHYKNNLYFHQQYVKNYILSNKTSNFIFLAYEKLESLEMNSFILSTLLSACYGPALRQTLPSTWVLPHGSLSHESTQPQCSQP